MWKHSRQSWISSHYLYILSIWSKMLLQGLNQIGFSCFYYHLIDIISDWAGNSLQVYKDSNQVILLKLQGMVFTGFTRENV